jgi:exodeoxyribonuclease-3
VLAGDFNVMPTELDVYKPERWVNDALFRAEVREAFRRLGAQGWTDALRTLHPNERVYTFWDYFRNAYARDAGLRIDHLLLSPSAATRLKAAGVDRQVRGWEKASDHAPVWIELADRAAGRAGAARADRPTRLRGRNRRRSPVTGSNLSAGSRPSDSKLLLAKLKAMNAIVATAQTAAYPPSMICIMRTPTRRRRVQSNRIAPYKHMTFQKNRYSTNMWGLGCPV